MTRREFLRTTTAAGAALAAVSQAAYPAPSPATSRAANERLGVGFIGAGSRSGSHIGCLNYLREKQGLPVDLVAVCDVYRPRMERAKQEHKMAQGTMDYRELLANPKVDVVCISTPDHHHGYQAIDAIRAGKDVYCEKPLSHWSQFELIKRLAETVAKSDRVFQLGTQGMSDSVWHQMKQLVKDGLIGRPVFGETSFFRLGDWGERGMEVPDKNAKPGADLNWEAFLGDRPKREFTVDRFFRWRLFEDYAGGPVTDIYPHCATQIVDILGVSFPEKVVAIGGIDRYEYELRDVPDAFNLLARYSEKVTISVLGSFANAYNSSDGSRGSGSRVPIIRGWDGTLTIDRNQKEIVFTPTDGSGKERKRVPIERGENMTDHWKNLIECCQKRQKTTWSPMDLAYRTQTMLIMAMLAHKNEKVVKFDAKEQKVIL
jgi:predicted dehydrogenase